MKVKKAPAAAGAAPAASPKKKGEKRKRDGSDDDGQIGAEKKVVVVDSSDEKPKSRPSAAGAAAAAAANKKAPKKSAVGLSAKVYKKFHGKNTLTENKQKLANMKKKERKVFRQQQKMGDNWTQLKEIKVIWESLRRASLDPEKRKMCCNALCEKIKGEREFCFLERSSARLLRIFL